jgi:hypothetical protein
MINEDHHPQINGQEVYFIDTDTCTYTYPYHVYHTYHSYPHPHPEPTHTPTIPTPTGRIHPPSKREAFFVSVNLEFLHTGPLNTSAT